MCSDPAGGMTVRALEREYVHSAVDAVTTVCWCRQYVSDPKKAIGGHIMAHACATRMMLRKGSGDTRIWCAPHESDSVWRQSNHEGLPRSKLYDSPSMPESEATFRLSTLGVCDVDD